MAKTEKGPSEFKYFSKMKSFFKGGAELDSKNSLEASYEEFKSFTMTGKQKFVATLSIIETLNLAMESISIVETGVWKGGMSFGMMKNFPECDEFHLFDSFEGLPEPTERDGKKALDISELNLFVAERNFASYSDLLRELDSLGFSSRAHVHKGWFEECVNPSLLRKPIGVLRMDGDWYDSTLVVLERLFDSVAPGGVIILDDYFDWPGCTQALHDFLSVRKRPEPIQTVNNFMAYLVKQPDDVLDHSVSAAEIEFRKKLNAVVS